MCSRITNNRALPVMNTTHAPRSAMRRNTPVFNVFCRLSLLSLLLLAARAGRAQLVPDGQTNILNGVITNVSGAVTIGTNDPFTLLILTNAAVVTNTGGNLVLGQGVGSQSNLLVVTGAGSIWNCTNGAVEVGIYGSENEMAILN